MRTGTMMALLLWTACIGAWGETLARFPMDSLKELNGPHSGNGFDIQEDQGTLRVAYTGTAPASITLVSVTPPALEDCTVMYQARVRCENVAKGACIEMLCAFPGKGEFFSRAVPQTLTGTQEWRDSQTSFFLKEGEVPEKISLGLRFEGPGIVWMDNVLLTKVSNSIWNPWGNPGAFLGVIGGGLGALVGIWGGWCGILAGRGRARRFVLGSGVAITLLGAVLFGIALCMYLFGMEWDYCYPIGLTGCILTLVVGLNLRGIRRRYDEAEKSRMQAQDAADDL